MNISQHAILANQWKLGQYSFDGVIRDDSSYSMTHWYPLSTFGFTLYYLEPDAVTLYGPVLGRYSELSSSDSSVRLSDISSPIVLDQDYCIFDGNTPRLPSKPFTYILI